MLCYFEPDIIVDPIKIRKNPAFGYRKCFYLPEKNLKQRFWKFLEPFNGIRVIYDHRGSQVIEYRSKKGIILLSSYINSKIFEVLPFSPEYHTVYATKLALSKRLAGYFEDYGVRQVICQKLLYNKSEEPLTFEKRQLDKSFSIK